MIIRSIFVVCLLFTLNKPAFSETDKYISTKVYVPDNQLAKVFEVSEGEIYVVRGNIKRMENFVELWARIILRNHDQTTLDMWNNENLVVNSNVDYAHIKMHFYCNKSEASFPAVYLFNKWSELVDSKVVLIDETFSTKDKPVIRRIKELACSGNFKKYE